ncbi:glycosyltransferase [Dyadobacter sp. CY261]|uniref:glycosyltransferase n=1 Tax=Dyadobacter sp. CY261 TaxID=2907203 RepID=UPI001F477A62|nr:glycosyltransferase [Dyadobacter sp. CY261]MCF0075130.1 glycosyltransferase [Dyadobacter sp. CY261]
MKILYLAHVSTVLGANRSLLNLISGLNGEYECTVIVPHEGPIVNELSLLEVKHRVIPFKQSSVHMRGSWIAILLIPVRVCRIALVNLVALIRLVIYVKKNKIQVIHSNSGAITLGYFVAKFAGIPHIWHLREFQDLDYNIEHWLGKQFLYKLLKKSSYIIAISKSVAEHFYPAKCAVVYNGLYGELPFSIEVEKKLNFLFCGALIPTKGLADAIEAIYKLNSHEVYADLIIAGEFHDKDFETEINQLVDKYMIRSKVHFLGFTNDVSSHMQQSLALLMCSKNEGFGRVTVEAMINRCAVIGFDNAGTKELIKDKETGFLYSSVEELVNAMKLVIEQPEERKKIEEQAYSYARNEFSVRNYVSQVQEIYKFATNG